MVRGAMERDGLVLIVVDAVAQGPQQARFADPRFAAQQHAAHFAIAALFPALAEHVEFGHPTDQRRQPAARPHFKAVDGVGP